MSRGYGMVASITGYNPKKRRAIIKAVKKEWPFKSAATFTLAGEPDQISFEYAESSLCGGEGEEEFADRLAKAVWKANDGYCEVTVHATYLDEEPLEAHIRDEEDYERLKPG